MVVAGWRKGSILGIPVQLAALLPWVLGMIILVTYAVWTALTHGVAVTEFGVIERRSRPVAFAGVIALIILCGLVMLGAASALIAMAR